MSDDNMTTKRVDPFAAFKFVVEVEGILKAFFMECSGLEISTDVFEYQEGGLNEYTHKLPGRMKLSNVTLKRGVAVSNELYNWFKKMTDDILSGTAISKKKVTIKLYSTVSNDKSMTWTLQDAFPVKWVGPSFKTDDSSIAVETIEFAHHGITMG